MSSITTWGSRDAEEMFNLATRLAGFDPKELMLEIHRLSGRRDTTRVNVRTVLRAIQNLADRDPEYQVAMTEARAKYEESAS